MSTGLSLLVSPAQVLRQSVKLTHAVQIAVTNRMLQLRLALIGELRGAIYTPDLRCGECEHSLTLLEVLKGYTSDPTDLHTTCPNCGHRFIARLRSGDMEIQWYCPMQALEALRGRAAMTPQEILGWNYSLYHSAVTHFGSVTNAFREMGESYTHVETMAWEDRVTQFLGKLPDNVIAEVVNAKPAIIRRMRQKLGISGFTRQRLAEEFA